MIDGDRDRQKHDDRPRVFLDTNVLLPGFAAWRAGNPPLYLADDRVAKLSFEKCVFESYMAFRGVGGKKPDEGRHNWAITHLKDVYDPRPVAHLTSRYHEDSPEHALFWLNHITGWEPLDFAKKYLRKEDWEAWAEDEAKRFKLKENFIRFQQLCDEFRQMLQQCHVELLAFAQVFGTMPSPWIDEERRLSGSWHPYVLDGLARDTAIPSEDFEIVVAAMAAEARLFLTNDKRLIRCAWSLGDNLPLSAANFALVEEYEDKVEALLLGETLSRTIID
jgi:hypothetical protein